MSHGPQPLAHHHSLPLLFFPISGFSSGHLSLHSLSPSSPSPVLAILQGRRHSGSAASKTLSPALLPPKRAKFNYNISSRTMFPQNSPEAPDKLGPSRTRFSSGYGNTRYMVMGLIQNTSSGSQKHSPQAICYVWGPSRRCCQLLAIAELFL